jgi:hypothetical protein
VVGRRRALRTGAAVAVAIALIGAGVAYAAVSSPTVPPGAAWTRIAIAENLDAAAVPDPVGDAAVDAWTPPAAACLERITRPGGWLDLCWSVSRMMEEVDPAKDYYVLRVWGTVSGNPAPSGLRWAVVRAHPDPASDPFEFRAGWPDTTYDGPCQDTTTDLGIFDPANPSVTVCGQTTALADSSDPESTGVEWTCAGCLLPMSTTQEILVTEAVAVPEGRSPIWDLYADIGS